MFEKLTDILPEEDIKMLSSDENPYRAKFVEKNQASEKRAEFKEVDPENIWKSLGLK